jgi:CheY-like chemotaxis protein
MTRILLVDDDELVRKALTRMLVRAKHDVSEASNGVAALKAVADTSFDLVITDLNMPDMEGLELIRKLRELPRPPKVILISGGDHGPAGVYLEIASKLGAFAVVLKPVSYSDLNDAVQRALTSE